MREVKSLLILAAFVLLACNVAVATVYFVNSETGNDANAGISHVQPWKTVRATNLKNFFIWPKKINWCLKKSCTDQN